MLALTDISQDVNCPASAEVPAAKSILELALKGVELEDLSVRVEELELQAARAQWLLSFSGSESWRKGG